MDISDIQFELQRDLQATLMAYYQEDFLTTDECIQIARDTVWEETAFFFKNNPNEMWRSL